MPGADPDPAADGSAARWRVLGASTVAFTLLFGVWTMLGVLSKPIQTEFRLTDYQITALMSAAVLAGALPRLVFGMLADSIGGRRVYLGLLLFCAIPACLVCYARDYGELLACTLGFGLAGNAFAAGISWNSAWFSPGQTGLALGVVGAGNVGAAVTKILIVLSPGILASPGLLGGWLPGGWRLVPMIDALALLVMAAVVFLITPARDRTPSGGRPLAQRLAPLRFLRVWRFSLYYVVVFGAYVALSVWLPRFYQDAYGLTPAAAALMTALFIFPASLLRPVGGWLSDRYGPRVVTYAVFLVMSLALVFLCVPSGTYHGVRYAPGVGLFTVLLVVVGCGMGVGKASVFKYVADYYPDDIGAVGGVVGALGALGGFCLPLMFTWLGEATGSPRMALAAPLGLTLVSLAWLHTSVRAIRAAERRAGAGSMGLAPPSTEG